MSLIANRYAQGFYDLSLQENAVEEYQNDLKLISDSYEAESEFREFLLSPQNDIIFKKQVLTNIFKQKVGKNTLNFLLLLLDKNRLKYLPQIYKQYVKIVDKEKNVLSINIVSAIPLEQEYIDIISEKYKKLFGAEYAKVTVEIDSSLIGGIKVSIGDKLFDSTVKGKLSELRSAMIV